MVAISSLIVRCFEIAVLIEDVARIGRMRRPGHRGKPRCGIVRWRYGSQVKGFGALPTSADQ